MKDLEKVKEPKKFYEKIRDFNGWGDRSKNYIMHHPKKKGKKIIPMQ